MNLAERNYLEKTVSDNLSAFGKLQASMSAPATLDAEARVGRAASLSDSANVTGLLRDIHGSLRKLKMELPDLAKEGRILVRMGRLLEMAHLIMTMELSLERLTANDVTRHGALVNATQISLSNQVQQEVDLFGRDLIAALRNAAPEVVFQDMAFKTALRGAASTIEEYGKNNALREGGLAGNNLLPSKVRELDRRNAYRKSNRNAPIPPELFPAETDEVKRVYTWAYEVLTDTAKSNWCDKYYKGYSPTSVLGPAYKRKETFNTSGKVQPVPFTQDRVTISDATARRVCEMWTDQKECTISAIPYFMISCSKHGNVGAEHYNILLKAHGLAGAQLMSLTGAKLNLHMYV